MIQSTPRRDGLYLAACFASLLGYLLCSQALRKFAAEVARLFTKYWGG